MCGPCYIFTGYHWSKSETLGTGSGGQLHWNSYLISVCSGEGHGNPLQYSCLENPMDRGAWRATVQGVSMSRTEGSWHTRTHWSYRVPWGSSVIWEGFFRWHLSSFLTVLRNRAPSQGKNKQPHQALFLTLLLSADDTPAGPSLRGNSGELIGSHWENGIERLRSDVKAESLSSKHQALPALQLGGRLAWRTWAACDYLSTSSAV